MAESVEAYAQRYLDINWSYGKDRFHGSVDHYLCMDKTKCDSMKVDGATRAHQWLLESAEIKKVPQRGGVFADTDPDGLPIHADSSCFDRAFTGKGTPNDLLETLRFATHVGQLTPDPAKVAEKCQTAKYYSHAYLGTDCNGFAMNYLGKKSGESIQKLDAGFQALRRKELKDIVPGDVMIVGQGYDHIAIVSSVDPPLGDRRTVHTWESLGKDYTKKNKLIGVCSQFRVMQKKATGIFVEVQAGVVKPTEFYFQPVADRGTPNP